MSLIGTKGPRPPWGGGEEGLGTWLIFSEFLFLVGEGERKAWERGYALQHMVAQPASTN